MALAGLAVPSRAPAQNQLTLIDTTSTVWRFNDSGTNLGTAWRAASFPGETNSGWSTGTGLFGVETTQPYPSLYPAPIHTPMVLGAGRITYYFRTRFLLPQDPASNIVEVTLWADDGAVVYVNGTEVARVRLTNDPVLFDTKAQLATPEGLPLVFTNDPTKLVLGTNVIAVEVHQQNENSSDVVFGLQMVATGTLAPAILDPTEPADRTVNQGQPTTFSVVGSGIPVPDFRWYHNGALVPGANGSTLTIAAVGAADAGNYFAVLSNSLGTASSRTAVLNYLADTNPPYLLYALGRDPSSFLLPFSEVPNIDAATDTFNWAIRKADGSDALNPLNITSAILTDGTNLTLTTFELRDPIASYVISNTSDIPDLNDQVLPAGTITPVASFLIDVIGSSNSWRYEHSGTDLGTNWVNAAFSDAGWSYGPAPLDVFRATAETPEPHCRSNGRLPATDDLVGTCLLSLSNAAGTAQISAAYFRTRFSFSGDAAHSVLSIQPIIVDDGAVCYLNGTELFRLGMPDGPVSYSTLANRTVGLAVPEFLELAPRGLVQGENVLAVEVHQDSLFSSDLTFGMTVKAFVPTVLEVPQLSSALSGGNITISWAPSVGRLQSAPDVGGPWTDVSPSDPPNPHTEPAVGARKFYRVAVP
jgi:hypothetical protein